MIVLQIRAKRLVLLGLATLSLYGLTGIESSLADSFFTETEVRQILSHGPWPPAKLPNDPGNEYSGLHWAETVGQYLFDATYLSGKRNLSCASCHQRALGFTDGKALAEGAAIHTRNTQGLWNVGLNRWFGWDGGADSQWAAAIRPMLSELEMAITVPQAAAALKRDSVLQEMLAAATIDQPESDVGWVVLAAKCIAAYTRTLISPVTEFDRYRDALASGDTTRQSHYPMAAKRGLKIFLGQGNCRVCHFGPNFSNGEFHDIGRPFFTGVGQVDPGRYRGIQRLRKDPFNLLGEHSRLRHQEDALKTSAVKLGQPNWGQWRTPSLRQLVETAPYMHDGSIRRLRDVVDTYADIDPARLHSAGESLLKPLDLTSEDRDNLVQFLETLSE